MTLDEEIAFWEREAAAATKRELAFVGLKAAQKLNLAIKP